MNKLFLPLVIALFVAGRLTVIADAAQNFQPDRVITVMKQVADWQLAHPNFSSKGSSAAGLTPNGWVQAVGYTGMMALYDVSKDPKYLDAMVAMGEKNQWKPGPRAYHADDFAVCQTYADIYAVKKDPRMIAPTIAAFNYILANPKGHFTKPGDPGFTFTKQDRWTWCDALFMAPPAWLRVYAETGDKRYLDFVDKEWWVTYQVLYDPAEKLFYRDLKYPSMKTPSGAKVFWGRGNGWVYAGLARIIPFIPQDDPNRNKYIQVFKEMTTSILKTQQPDGMWRPSLLDPNQIAQGETSGSALLVYGLAWGVNNGILDSATVWPAVAKGWTALVGKVHPDGKLGAVQPVGEAPKPFSEDSAAPYGTGAFLLAGSEIYKHELPLRQGTR